jgi:pilus assembly protein TadC
MQSSDNLTVIQAIQLMLAPAVMINGCGLLLLSISNKFSSVVNRVRLLNEERRKLFARASDPNFGSQENQRLESIARQLDRLLRRAKMVRNSLLCYSIAVALFVLTSLLIGFDYFVVVLQLKQVIIASFMAGLVIFFCGVIFAALDTLKGYEIVKYDVVADE